jgi:exodeoxyribonuclease-3
VFRLVTWNVNSLRARLGRVEEWLAANDADVVCLQETKCNADNFPALSFSALGYESVHHGQGQWNGVAILSRVGIENPVFGFDDGDEEDPEARFIRATCGGVRVGCVYVPNGRALDNDHYTYKLAWLSRLRRTLDASEDPSGPFAISGDWNIAPDDRDVWDPSAFVDATHVSVPEREALDNVVAWGLQDVFRNQYDADGLFSWWDYRGGSFHKGLGMRIDYVLATEALASTATSALIDRNARKGKQPSDHAPVVCDFDLDPKATS